MPLNSNMDVTETRNHYRRVAPRPSGKEAVGNQLAFIPINELPGLARSASTPSINQRKMTDDSRGGEGRNSEHC